MIFITEPRTFEYVDNTNYTICGIEAKINNSEEVVIGSKDSIKVEILFYTKGDTEEYKEKRKSNRVL